MTKETKAQRVERLKQQQCGLDVLPQLYDYAASGQPIDADTVDRMKYYGLYVQRHHDQDPPGQYLMVRIKLVGGEISRQQWAEVVALSRRYARGSFDLTTRQDIQLHWVACRDLPEIFRRLDAVGLTTRMGSGDCVRNIVSCPAAGLDRHELLDVRPLVEQVNRHFDDNRQFINLPRKLKIAISGCRCHCVRHEIQDLSFVAQSQQGQVVFDVSVGGGLSGGRQFAQRLGRSCRPEQVVDVADAVATLFRDHGCRDNRAKARVRHLVAQWGIDTFCQHLEQQLGYRLADSELVAVTPLEQRHHYGRLIGQQPQLISLGCKTAAGRLGAELAAAIERLMDQYPIPSLRLTPTQDLLLVDLPAVDVEAVEQELERHGLSTRPSPFRLHSTACTGLEYCKFAVSETKQFAAELLRHLENSCPQWQRPLTIAISGCPHGCSHPYIGDIGLVGCVVKDESGQRHSGYELYFGGQLAGPDSQFAQSSGVRLVADEVAAYLAQWLNQQGKTSTV